MVATGVVFGLIIGIVVLGLTWILSAYGLGITSGNPESPIYKTSAAFAIIGFLGAVGCTLALVYMV